MIELFNYKWTVQIGLASLTDSTRKSRNVLSMFRKFELGAEKYIRSHVACSLLCTLYECQIYNHICR